MTINAGWVLNAIVDFMVTTVLVYYLYRDREVAKRRHVPSGSITLVIYVAYGYHSRQEYETCH